MSGYYLRKRQLPLTEVFSIVTLVYWDLNPLESKPASSTRMIMIMFPNMYKQKTGSPILMDSLHVFWIEWYGKQLIGRKQILP